MKQSPFYGVTDFNLKNLINIEFEGDEISFNEEKGIASIQLKNKFNYKKNGSIYEVNREHSTVRLSEKTKLFPIIIHHEHKLQINEEELKLITEESKSINSVTFRIFLYQSNCKLNLVKIKRFNDVNSWISPNEEQLDEKYEFDNHSFLEVCIEGFPDLSGIRNLLLQFLETQFLGMDSIYEVILSKDRLIIFPLICDSESYAVSLIPILDTFVEYLREYSYDQFYNCICQDGCFNCLLDTRYEERGMLTDPLGKNKLFKILAKLRNEDNIDELISVRANKHKISNLSFQEIITNWRKLILEIFKSRMSFLIEDVFIIKKAKLEPTILGTCSLKNQEILINETLSPLNVIVEVIAHEYTHNWQAENMSKSLQEKSLPFDGKLYVEGFAQWVAFRIMDYLGHHVNLKSITLRGVDSTNIDEYGLGFRICRHIEEQYGSSYLIEFIKKGKLKIRDEIVNHKALAEDFGLYNYMNT